MYNAYAYFFIFVTEFANQNGAVSDSSALSCDFSGQCCWGNAKPPDDRLDWVKVAKSPSGAVLKPYFGTDQQPCKPTNLYIYN